MIRKIGTLYHVNPCKVCKTSANVILGLFDAENDWILYAELVGSKQEIG